MPGLPCRRLPLALKVGIRASGIPHGLLNPSTNQPCQHDARLPHGRWSLPPSWPDFCDKLVWRCGSAETAGATQLIGKNTAPAVSPLFLGGGEGGALVLARSNNQKSITTTPRVLRQPPSLYGLNECCLEILVGRAGRRRGRRGTLSS
jgi:hypothetical protein